MKLSEIIVKRRIRESQGSLEKLKKSIDEVGLLNPIIVDNSGRLIAGERRLQAIKQLGWEAVEVKIISDPDAYTQLSMEIEENLHRKDFTFEEYGKAMEEKKKLEARKEKSFLGYAVYLFKRWLLRWFKRL